MRGLRLDGMGKSWNSASIDRCTVSNPALSLGGIEQKVLLCSRSGRRMYGLLAHPLQTRLGAGRLHRWRVGWMRQEAG